MPGAMPGPEMRNCAPSTFAERAGGARCAAKSTGWPTPGFALEASTTMRGAPAGATAPEAERARRPIATVGALRRRGGELERRKRRGRLRGPDLGRRPRGPPRAAWARGLAGRVRSRRANLGPRRAPPSTRSPTITVAPTMDPRTPSSAPRQTRSRCRTCTRRGSLFAGQRDLDRRGGLACRPPRSTRRPCGGAVSSSEARGGRGSEGAPSIATVRDETLGSSSIVSSMPADAAGSGGKSRVPNWGGATHLVVAIPGASEDGSAISVRDGARPALPRPATAPASRTRSRRRSATRSPGRARAAGCAASTASARRSGATRAPAPRSDGTRQDLLRAQPAGHGRLEQRAPEGSRVLGAIAGLLRQVLHDDRGDRTRARTPRARCS